MLGELGGTALFGARFRENAARALLIPRRRPGRRTPLWQQRLKASSLLQVARRFGSFPVILETYRECLNDWFDLPALRGVLRRVESREIAVVEVETPTASPFAGSLLFEYVASYMYEDDTPAAERRAQALSLNRDLLRELLGQEELRDLIDPGALAAVEADLQGLSERARARGPDGLHDLLRRIGDLNADEVAARLAEPARGREVTEALVAERRAVWDHLAGEDRLIAVEDAGRDRDGLGVMPPSGLPGAFLEPLPDALRAIVARYARSHGPFHTAELAARYALEPRSVEPALAALEADGALVRGELRPGGSGREWCDVEVVRGCGARASLRCGARSSRPTRGRSGASCRTGSGWTGPGGPWRQRPARRARDAPGPGPAPRPVGGRGAAAPAGRLCAGAARRARGAWRDRLGGRGRRRRRRRPRRDLLPRGRPDARPAAGRSAARGGGRRGPPARSPAAPASGTTCSRRPARRATRSSPRSGAWSGPARSPTTSGCRCARRGGCRSCAAPRAAGAGASEGRGAARRQRWPGAGRSRSAS